MWKKGIAIATSDAHASCAMNDQDKSSAPRTSIAPKTYSVQHPRLGVATQHGLCMKATKLSCCSMDDGLRGLVFHVMSG